MLLITSDPVINTFRELPQKNIVSFSDDILNLLKFSSASVPPETPISHFQPPEQSQDLCYLVSDSRNGRF